MLVRVWPPPGSPHKRGPWVAGRRRVARLIGTCLKAGVDNSVVVRRLCSVGPRPGVAT